MAADVVGGYALQETQTSTVGNRSKWLRGKWANDKNKAFSISFDCQHRHQSRKSSDGAVRVEPRRHRSEPDASSRCSSPSTLLDGGHSADAPSVEPPLKTAVILTERRAKGGNKRPKPFKRAFSYETTATDVTIVDIKSKTRSSQSENLEMTYVEMEQTMAVLRQVEADSDVLGNKLKAIHRDNGIVCSDEDLRSILSSTMANDICRLSADIRREKMKSNRSLSLDSSFFKLRIRRLQADSPNWLSKIISQRERNVKDACNVNEGSISLVNKCEDDVETAAETEATTTAAAASATPCVGLVEHRRSTFAVADKPSTITEDSSSIEGDLSSRRESTVSGGTSDDESSLLLQRNGQNNNLEEYANPCNVEKQQGSATVASKVVWNEESEVDAEVLGHAIEFYLTSTIKSSSGHRGHESGQSHCKGSRNSAPDAVGPVVSTLKGLFVK